MVHLTVTALELTNHGPFRGPHRFELPSQGPAVWIRPNEFGKTTLLESVAAVLWGETAISKNWSSSPQEPHRGALEFVRRESDQFRRYRVERDFQTHEVLAWELDADGGRQELFRGTHNPAGRTADHRRWPDYHSPKLFAAISCEAFRHLAMLTQPLPEELHGNLIQQLVSGGGSSTAEDAQNELLERFRSLSKFSKDAGLSDRNARNDGRLDGLVAQRNQLQAEVSQAAGELDRAETLREQLQQFDQRQKKLTENREAAESSLETIERYRGLKEQLRNAAERAKEHENALQQAENAAQEIDAADKQAVRLTELANPHADEIPRLKQQLDNYRLRRAGLSDPERLAEKRAELKRQYADVWDWPEDAGPRIRSLQESAERGGDVRREIEPLQRRFDEVRPRPDNARRCFAAAAAGLLVGVAATTLIGVTVSWPWGLAVGFLALLAAGATTYVLYQPRKIPPDHDRLAAELAAANRRLGEIEAATEAARASLDWTDEPNLTRLVRLAERLRILRRELQEREEEETRQSALRAELDPAELPDPLPHLLRACRGDPDEATRRLDRFQAACNQRKAAEGKLRTALGTLGCRDRDELDIQSRQWQDRRVGIRRDLDRLVEQNAWAEELKQMPGTEIEAKRNALQKELEQNRSEFEALQQRRRNVERDLAAAESNVKINVADRETQRHRIEAEIERLGGRCEAIKQAHHLLALAAGRYSAHHRQAIEQRINDLMRAWTGVTDRRFTVAENFSLRLLIEGAGGQPHEEMELSVLSQGAWDQLALAVRIAVLDRIATEVVLPILIDDAFVTWDQSRRERLLGAIQSAAAARQFILVSHDAAFETWGQPIVYLGSKLHYSN